MAKINVRKEMPPVRLERQEFERRFRARFHDPVFAAVSNQLQAVIEAAWDGYHHSRKSPLTRRAGSGFADPDYQIALDWLVAQNAVHDAQLRHDDPAETPRILVINSSPRSEHTCPGETSKTWRMVELALSVFQDMRFATDVLNLSRLTAEFGKTIHPCKACASTSMPLCHWPCSCYPNYALGQTDDMMNEIYPLWVAAHGIMIVTPVHWYQAPTVLKAMIDRLVCADGGNPDPSSTHGKTVVEAKELELRGWPYPRHLAGRHFSIVVHGDSAGAGMLRRALSDWLTDMELIAASRTAELDGYVGYMEPYATSHQSLDNDVAFQKDVLNAARALGNAVLLHRAGRYETPDAGLIDPEPK